MAAPAATSRQLLALAAAVCLAVVCLQASPSRAMSRKYTVGGAEGWRVPPPEEKERYYADWASNFTFYVYDVIKFVYKNDSVIRVGKAGYYHCNEAAPSPGAAHPRDGARLFVLDAPGPAYFASADPARCAMGERLMVNVLAAAAAAAGPSPWSPSSPPPGPSAHHHHSTAAAATVTSSAARAAAAVLALAAVGRFV